MMHVAGSCTREAVLVLLLMAVFSLVMAASAHPLELPEPDAGLVAQKLTGSSSTINAVSWDFGEVKMLDRRRVWLDVFGVESLTGLDFSDVGGGLSADVTPGDPFCAGGGWKPHHWMIYAGYHIGW